ncbi:MAG: hypothetical protein PUF04_09330 [bacterium]|nr:hypothetical protein [bacterium]
MNNKEFVLDTLYRAGQTEARKLREKAVSGEADGTAIIASEQYVPTYPVDGKRDFTSVPIGAPYMYEGQVYTLWVQHNANGNPDWTPDKSVSLWNIAHTTDPKRAKPYMQPAGTRGLYRTGECMIWTDGSVQRSKIDNNAYTPETYPDGWEQVTV